MIQIVNSTATIIALNDATVAANNASLGACASPQIQTILSVIIGLCGLFLLGLGIYCVIQVIDDFRFKMVDASTFLNMIGTVLAIVVGVGSLWLTWYMLFS